MSSKVTKEGTNKLLRLLYDTTASEARRRAPLVTKNLDHHPPEAISTQSAEAKSAQSAEASPNRLYSNEPEGPSPRSVLDGLMANEWNQKPLSRVLADLPRIPSITDTESNVLMFKCPNLLIVNTDFYNLYPVQRDRVYALPSELKHGIQFCAVKARNPWTLSFNHLYYLVFPSYIHAATYWLETRNKTINGFPLLLRFVSPMDHLPYMSSPFLDFQSLPSDNTPDATTRGSTSDLVDTFKSSPTKSNLLNQIQANVSNNSDNYESLSSFIDFSVRNACVLVKNLPFGLSKHALPRLLWDYDFPEHVPLSQCFVQVLRAPLNQINLNLIRFKDHENAKRFVRSFHGKKWHGFRSDKERVKRLYEPILCEILN